MRTSPMLRGIGQTALVLGWALTLGGLEGQPNSLPVIHGYVLNSWGARDGLPENSANAVAQTRDGYYWIATFNGLARFDGRHFRYFNRANTPGLPSSGVVHLHVDQQDRLWVSTDHGLVRLRGQQWTSFGAAQGLTGNYVRSWAESPAGEFVLATFDGGLFRLDGEVFRAIESPNPGGTGGHHCAFEWDGSESVLWATRPPHALAYLRDGQWHTPAGWTTTPPTPVRGVTTAADGSIWTYTEDRLLRFRRGQLVQEMPIELEGEFWDLTTDRRGWVWITSSTGGFLAVRPDGSALSFGAREGVTNYGTRCVYEDHHSTIWVGTSGAGLIHLTPASVVTWGQETGLPTPNVRSVAALGPGHLLAGTFGGGAFEIVGGRARPAAPVDSPAAALRNVLAVCADQKGNLWAGGYQSGLFGRSAGSDSQWRKVGLDKATIHSLYEDRTGTVWIGLDSGLARFRDDRLEIVRSQPDLPPGAVLAMAEDPDTRDLWLGIQGAGLARLTGDRAELLPVPDGWKAALEDTHALLAQPNETLWIGTESGGLFRWQAGRLAPAELPGTIPQTGISSLLADDTGDVWMGTSRGLVRMGIADLHAAVDQDRPLGGATVLDQRAGMRNPDCANGSQPSAARGRDGRLYFATLGGVAVVDPTQVPPLRPPPRVLIEGVRSAGETLFRPVAGLAQPPPLELNAHQRDLVVTFSAPTGLGDALEFRYRFGGNDEWLLLQSGRNLVLPRLAPGSYRLHLAAVDAAGRPAAGEASLLFHIAPFLWETLGFRSAASATGALALVSLVAYVFRHREKRRESQRAQQAAVSLAQRRLASILQNTSDLVAFADANRRPLYMNAAGRRLLGLAEGEDLSAQNPADLYAPWANDLILREGLPTAMREGVWRGRTAIRGRSGQEIQVSQVITAHYKADGSLDFTSTIIRDISPLVQAVKAVEVSEARFRNLWESCPMGIYTYELQGRDRLIFTGGNPAADRIVGVDHQRFLGKTIEAAFPPLAETEAPGAFRRAALHGEPWSTPQLDYEHEDIRGSFEVYAFQTAPRKMAVMFMEITARKQAELALRESEERFRQLAGSIREVFYLVDWPDRHYVYVSPAFETIWGRHTADLYGNPALWSGALSPRDRERVYGVLERQIDEGEWTDEYPIKRPDGAIRWIRDRAFAIRDHDGRVHRLAGVAEDITEHHQAEVAEQAFRRLAQSLVGTVSLSDLAQTVALTCRTLFHQEAFFLELLDPQTLQRTPVYAEDTRAGLAEPETVRGPQPELASSLLNQLCGGRPTILDQSSAEDLEALGAWGFEERRAASAVLSPIVAEGQCVGLIGLQSYTPRRFQSRDADLLQTLANQCAASLLRVRAEETLRQLNRELESKVRERTEELQRIVNLMAGRETRMAELKVQIRELQGQRAERPISGAEEPQGSTETP